ncbi:MAG: TIGR00282 family metallophosphoesterase [Candidatus Hydrogenedentes bacterium]|nr:TIGR00282 family metallophosphoesterase [Candidatus Hydrogenedentota bacterium]
MRILFVGDIVGRPGRRAAARWLPELRREYEVDVILANAENAAGGLGATPEVLNELRRAGVEGFTLGNHAWRKPTLLAAIDGMNDVVRPANFPNGVPGRGACVLPLPDGRGVGLLNLMGRVFMTPFECPFERAAHELRALRALTRVIIVDFHAEATSEKVAMGWRVDGQCSAVLGTHTHVPTADERILPGGTAYITDVGMTGPRDGIIGTDRDAVLTKFVTGLPRQFSVAKGPAWLNAVLVEIDEASGRATSMERIARTE